MSKIYLITYNIDGYFSRGAFHDHIDSLLKDGIIKDWWHYIDATYLIVSDRDINTVHNNIFRAVHGKNLFIVEINPGNAQGWLPKGAWDWLSKYSR